MANGLSRPLVNSFTNCLSCAPRSGTIPWIGRGRRPCRWPLRSSSCSDVIIFVRSRGSRRGLVRSVLSSAAAPSGGWRRDGAAPPGSGPSERRSISSSHPPSGDSSMFDLLIVAAMLWCAFQAVRGHAPARRGALAGGRVGAHRAPDVPPRRPRGGGHRAERRGRPRHRPVRLRHQHRGRGAARQLRSLVPAAARRRRGAVRGRPGRAMALPNLRAVVGVVQPEPFATVLWEDRSLDVLLQVVLIIGGVLAVLGPAHRGAGARPEGAPVMSLSLPFLSAVGRAGPARHRPAGPARHPQPHQGRRRPAGPGQGRAAGPRPGRQAVRPGADRARPWRSP